MTDTAQVELRSGRVYAPALRMYRYEKVVMGHDLAPALFIRLTLARQLVPPL